MINLEETLEYIVNISKNVGKFQKESANLNEEVGNINKKKSSIDLVTRYDINSEQMIIYEIRKKFPKHKILTEELGILDSKSDYEWIIDPIDGTTNFIHKLPFFSISIALKYKNEIVLGVVHSAMLGLTFKAIKGKGAYLNDQRIYVSKREKLLESVISTGFPYDRAKGNINIPYFLKIVNKVAGVRRFGSAALDIAFVASGNLEAYWEFSISEWDYSAGKILVEEAGGDFEIREIEGREMIIVTNRNCKKEFMNSLFSKTNKEQI